jgi:MarR family 2-MHQ and catechol resistance regulon transcriptional repressor
LFSIELMKRDPSLDAYASLCRAAARLEDRVARRLAVHGLASSRISALCALHEADPLCPRDIAVRLGQTRGNVTMILDDLEKRGLVERRHEGVNRRFRAVYLTAAGRRFIAALKPRRARAVAAELKALSRADQRALFRLCRRLSTDGPTHIAP